METSFIVTFIGDDRPGLVEQFASVIESNRGNWHESRLSQLGGKFAGLILVSLPADGRDRLEADLQALSSSGLNIGVTPAGSAAVSIPGRQITLTVIGPDRLGIVREISRALAERQVNVVEMDSQVASAPMSGEMIFRARIDAEVPENLALEDLHDTLDEIANHMTLEIDLEAAGS